MLISYSTGWWAPLCVLLALFQTTNSSSNAGHACQSCQMSLKTNEIQCLGLESSQNHTRRDDQLIPWPKDPCLRLSNSYCSEILSEIKSTIITLSLSTRWNWCQTGSSRATVRTSTSIFLS
ncbi:hypothetical protein JB92DRAFT_42084 [Gautieria morchelliformis]|nr:hypothetical protein JB92DRAFT_42084 [Gautieria morchelliformis]